MVIRNIKPRLSVLIYNKRLTGEISLHGSLHYGIKPGSKHTNNMTSSRLVSPQKVVPSFTRTLLPDHNHTDRGVIPHMVWVLIHLYGTGLTKRGQGLWVGYASCMICDMFPRHASIVESSVPYTNWVMRINGKFMHISRLVLCTYFTVFWHATF